MNEQKWKINEQEKLIKINIKIHVQNNNNKDDKLKMVCLVCHEFNTTTLTKVNTYIDGCLTQTMREDQKFLEDTFNIARKKIKEEKS